MYTTFTCMSECEDMYTIRNAHFVGYFIWVELKGVVIPQEAKFENSNHRLEGPCFTISIYFFNVCRPRFVRLRRKLEVPSQSSDNANV